MIPALSYVKQPILYPDRGLARAEFAKRRRNGMKSRASLNGNLPVLWPSNRPCRYLPANSELEEAGESKRGFGLK